MAVRGVVKTGEKTLQHLWKKGQSRLAKFDPVEDVGKNRSRGKAGACEPSGQDLI